jgi:hypothetical protein
MEVGFGSQYFGTGENRANGASRKGRESAELGWAEIVTKIVFH